MSKREREGGFFNGNQLKTRKKRFSVEFIIIMNSKRSSSSSSYLLLCHHMVPLLPLCLVVSVFACVCVCVTIIMTEPTDWRSWNMHNNNNRKNSPKINMLMNFACILRVFVCKYEEFQSNTNTYTHYYIYEICILIHQGMMIAVNVTKKKKSKNRNKKNPTKS